ncbi:signal transduction histidine kinase [Duganella sp. 3397]|uniref:sensor histidine kinase n=1 Tax=Duganella sp. 3397 TaxID=2817732 RepID=UPI0028593852|nr:sensor histidine kinase [Duganella sp. 3397]MDR7047761.1 signal transduction histidine kinase [Duganella sp. 3397]
MTEISAENVETSAKLELKVAAHVVIQLGRELVSDEEQALLELVKNAYDANSPDCVIHLDPDWIPPEDDIRLEFLTPPISKQKREKMEDGADEESASVEDQEPELVVLDKKQLSGRIYIVDRGDGAAPEDVHQSWLTVSFSRKRPEIGHAKRSDDGKRVPVGDKGLGRLATMKLGRVLTFTTALPGAAVETSTSFCWDDFSNVQTVDQVRVRETKIEREVDERGSTVEIIGLHDPDRWKSQESVTRLIGRLSALVNPFSPIPDFEIKISKKGKPFDLQQVGQDALKFSPASFEYNWDGAHLKCGAKISRGLFRGTKGDAAKKAFERVFSDEAEVEKFLTWVKQHKKYSKKLTITGSSAKATEVLFTCGMQEDLSTFPTFKNFPLATNPGKFNGNFYYFLFNEDEIAKLKTIQAGKEQIQNMSGVAVFRDGFRIRMPDDWIGLAEGTTSGGFFYLRPRNTLGYFSLSNEFNSNLIEKSDREGFVDNIHLRGFMALSLKCRDYANMILDTVRTAFTEYERSLVLKESDTSVKSISKKLKNSNDSMNAAISAAREDIKKTSLSLTDARSIIENSDQSENNTVAISNALSVIEKSLSTFENRLSNIGGNATEISNASNVLKSIHDETVNKQLRLLEAASVGLSARMLVHELHTYLDRIEGAARILVKKIRGTEDIETRRASSDLSSAASELRKVVSAIDPLLPGSRTIREIFSAKDVVEKIFENRKSIAEISGIRFNIEGVQNLCVIRFNMTRFYQVIENLLQNSLYWLPKSEQKDKIVNVRFSPTGFSWWDSGNGIASTIEESLFDVFETSKPAGEGQGLGLHIVKTFLEAENCSISLLNDRNESGLRYIFALDLSGAVVSK